MAKTRVDKKAAGDREAVVYIPLTRMNFVAFVDAGFFAAPAFLKCRQRYDDVLCAAENALVGFETPVHDSVGWVDSDETMNFPVIAQVSIPRSWIARDHDAGMPKKSKRHGPSISPLAIRRIVPIERLVQVLVPGPATVQLLREDPFLENLPVKIIPTSEVDGAALALVIPAVDGGGASCDQQRLEHELRCVAALALCTTVAESADWQDQWTRFSNVEPFVAAGLQFLTSRSVSTAPPAESWLPAGDRFFSDILDDSSDAEVLTRRLQNVPSASLRELDEGVTVVVGRILMDEGISGGSIETSMARLRDLLQRISSERPAYGAAIDRIERGLELAERIATGVRSPEEMFNQKTEWAHSVRTCGLMLLRSDVQGVTTWPCEEKPNGALVQDLLLVGILTGLYVGFTKLPRLVKAKFASLLNSVGDPVDGSVEASRELASTVDDRGLWKLAYAASHGRAHLRVSMSDKSASLWSALNTKSTPRCQHSLRELIVARCADLQMDEGTIVAATIRRDDGQVKIRFDSDSILHKAQKAHSVQYLHAAATAFDGEFGLCGGAVMPALISAADRVLQHAGEVTKKPGKNSLAKAINAVCAQQGPRLFGDYDRLRSAIRICRILTTSMKKLSPELAASANRLLESPVSGWF